MRLKPIVTQCLLAGILSVPTYASAVGLGKLTVQSALGQPLVAEVDLAAVSGSELSSLTARVADPAAYQQNNLDYPASAARVRVEVAKRPNGAPYLKITSPQSVNDPYLDLLIELNWASGRLSRNYTFLLDPPGIGAPQRVEPVPPVAAPATASAARVAARPQSTSAPAAPSAPAVPAVSAPVAGSLENYLVKRGDTLHGIAVRTRPPAATLEQMLVALFNANPSAFDGKNMNRLRAGEMLAVPKPEEVMSLPKEQAAREVRVQAADWAAYRNRVAAAAPTRDVAAPTQESAGTITTAVEDKGGATAPGGDRLMVSRGDASATGAAVGPAASAAARAEDLVAKDKALAEMNARVAELEKTVADLRRALELKSETLAQVQRQAEVATAAPAAPAKAAPATAAPATAAPAAAAPMAAAPVAPVAPKASVQAPVDAKAAAAKAVAPKAVAPKADEATPAPKAAEPAPTPAAAASTPAPKAAEPVSAPKATEPASAPKAGEPAPAPTAAESAPAPKAAEAVPVPKAAEPAPAPGPAAKAGDATTPKPLPARDQGFLERLLADTPGWVVGGGALAVLAGLWALLAARRRREKERVEETLTSTDLRTSTVFGHTAGGVVNTGEPSISSDFSREGLGSIDTDEVDPIAEAEVYLAYGRDAQAEEILKEALKRDPQRQEAYLKLLEIHSQHNKPSSFESVASELHAVTGGRGETWEKAAALGRQLDPTNKLYAAPGMGASAVAGVAGLDLASRAKGGETVESFTQKPELAPERPAAPASPATPATPAAPTAELDFDLDRFIPGAKSDQPAAPVAERAEPEPSEFDLGLGESERRDQPAVESKLRTEEAAERSEKQPFDFDLKLDEILGEPSVPGAPSGAVAPQGDDQDVATLDFTPTPAKVAAAVQPHAKTHGHEVPAADEMGLDKLGFDFDVSGASFDEQAPALEGPWQDAATKLDLAKAYQEMGDVEGAREILQEVLKEGDDQQKKDAQALLTKL